MAKFQARADKFETIYIWELFQSKIREKQDNLVQLDW